MIRTGLHAGRVIAAAAAISIGLTGAALAQKARDTLRIAFTDPIATTDSYIDPKPEASIITDAVFEKLMAYLPAENAFKPVLAESWTQTSPTVLDVKLREGVTFHDGQEFTADDVVYTLNYLIDPNSKLRFAANWAWIERVERTGRYSVRIVSKQPTPFALARLATGTVIFPKHVHSKFESAGDFGRMKPIGTGPYKVEYVDSSKGIRLRRNEDYKSPGPWSPKASIGTIDILPMPELQTQIAQLMTGGIEIVLSAPKDQTEQLAMAPNITATAIHNTVYYYANLDAAGRSGVKALTDRNVRRALFMAIDRKAIAESMVAGGDQVQVVSAPCTDLQFGCKASVEPVAFNVAEAKKLLAEAGYPNGFDLEITSLTGAHEVAEAVSGQLRAIGVRAAVNRMTMGGYRKRQAAGQLQMLVGHFSSGGLPDVSSVLAFYQGGVRDYWRDEQLQAYMEAGVAEMDAEKRAKIYESAFNRMNEQALVLPISNRPAVLVHSTDVKMPNVSSIFAGPELNNIGWSK